MKALTLTIHKVWSMLKFVADTDRQADREKTIFSWSIDAGLIVDLKHCPMQNPSLNRASGNGSYDKCMAVLEISN